MSQAVVALLLLRLEARRGEWVPTADLAGHLALHETVVRAHLLTMESSGTALLRRAGGGAVHAASAPAPRDAAGPPPKSRPVGAAGAAKHLPPHPAADRAVDTPSIAPNARFQPNVTA